MRLPQVVIFLLTLFTTAHAFALPSLNDFSSASHDLFKRKGGGGGGGGRGGGGGSSSSSGGSSSGSSGSSSSGSRGGGSTGGTSSGGNTGGISSGGGRSPSYSGSGGRTYYGGGASTPYSSRGPSPSGRFPIALAAGSAALFILPGIWLYSVYNYNYQRPWTYYNQTSNQNVTHPVQCLCEENRDCGCDEDNSDQDYINNVANNGSVAALGNINGTETLVLNGTVPYGADSSSGSSTTLPPNAALRLPIGGAGGWAIVAGSLTAALWLGL